MGIKGNLTVREAAEVLGVSIDRVYQFARDGRLKGARIGRMILFPERQVRQFAKIERRPGRPPEKNS